MLSRPVSTLAFAFLVGVSFGCGGCGGGAAPPLTPDVPQEAGPETFAEVNPADLAELDAGSPAAPKDGGASAPEPSKAAPGSVEAKDECTPVGVDFEKRARPKLKECYAQGKKKDANLQGTIKLSLEIDTLGKVKGVKVVEKTLPESVAQCMLKVVKSTPLPEPGKCAGKSLTIPMTFPTPH